MSLLFLDLQSSVFWFPLLLLLIPLYAANGGAMLIGKRFPSASLDLNHRFPLDSRVWFGPGKTINGSLGGIILAVLLGALAVFLFPVLLTSSTLPFSYAWFCALAGFGAIMGDLLGSFIKRRLNMKSGEPSPVLDQLDFVLGGFLVLWPFFQLSLVQWLAVVLITLIAHQAGNRLAYAIGLKSVPW